MHHFFNLKIAAASGEHETIRLTEREDSAFFRRLSHTMQYGRDAHMESEAEMAALLDHRLLDVRRAEDIWARLYHAVLPPLLKERRELHVVSMGAALGEELYSFLMMLNAYAAEHGIHGIQVHLYAYSNHIECLKCIAEGQIPGDRLEKNDTPERAIATYFRPGSNGWFYLRSERFDHLAFSIQTIPVDLSQPGFDNHLVMMGNIDLLFYCHVEKHLPNRGANERLAAMRRMVRPQGYLVSDVLQSLIEQKNESDNHRAILETAQRARRRIIDFWTYHAPLGSSLSGAKVRHPLARVSVKNSGYDVLRNLILEFSVFLDNGRIEKIVPALQVISAHIQARKDIYQYSRDTLEAIARAVREIQRLRAA